jgi:alpha-mannosidase
VDEGDVNVVAPEAVIRQVLYGNQFFAANEFGSTPSES